MEMRQRETRKKENPIQKVTMQLEKEAKEFVEKRLDEWITRICYPIHWSNIYLRFF